MARKPPVSDDKLYAVATYLAKQEAQTEIHAELPERHRSNFEAEYNKATKGRPLPSPASGGPYYVWDDSTDKHGRELRIYFMPHAPEPPIIDELRDQGKRWHGKPNQRRINHSNLVMQLFECGFVLGLNNDYDRLDGFMKRRFPVRG